MMRTKQLVVMGLVLLGLLVGREAQAFYNPSSGRWLSRDPTGEIQRPKTRAENLYLFCGNDGVDYWDYLGRR